MAQLFHYIHGFCSVLPRSTLGILGTSRMFTHTFDTRSDHICHSASTAFHPRCYASKFRRWRSRRLLVAVAH